MPAREPEKQAKLTGMDLVRAQQHALTVPADKLPALPPGRAPRAQRAGLPAGTSAEDAELAERMTLVADPNCTFYGLFAVCGEIRNKYNAMGGPASFLGFPKSPEYVNPGNTGARSEFLHGSIYWSAATGAHPVTPLFMTKWSFYGWEAGSMGYPTSDEIPNGDNIGSRQDFQKENAAIYWNSAITGPPGLTVIKGLIRAKWNTLGAQAAGSLLGYPSEDEKALPDGQGHMSRFERGVIYWHPTTGAHPVIGSVLAQWAAAGYEQSSFGYPIADPVQSGSALEQQFQNDRIYTPGIPVPFAPGLFLTYGIAASGQLQATPIPDGLVYHGSGFDLTFRSTPSHNTGHLALTLTGAQAPQQFTFVVGLPGGYSLQHSEYEVRMLDPTGSVVAAIGDPVAANSVQQGVPIQTNVSGNQITYQVGQTTAYPVKAASNIASKYNPYTRIGKETSKACALSPYDCSRSIPAYFDATYYSEQHYPQFINADGTYQNEDDRIDADRHCLWQAMTTEAANAGFAEELGDAHEVDKYSGYEAGVMDQYNNITGRAVGLRNEGDVSNIISTCNAYADSSVLVTDVSTVDQSNPNENDLIRFN